MTSDWKWGEETEKESTVFPTVSAVAVYTNPNGSIVIRQEGYAGEDDSIVIIPRIHVESILLAIKTEYDDFE